MLSYISSALLAVSVLATVDYTQNGADWPDECQSGEEQSPINLVTDTDTSDSMEIIGYNYYDFPKADYAPADPS